MATAVEVSSPAAKRPLHRRADRDPWKVWQWTAALIGIALRLRQYIFLRSLWGDEASIALNIIHSGYWALTRQLTIQQAAPFGWLWVERATYQVLGPNEYSLRLQALVAGILLMCWTLSLVRRYLSGPAGTVTLLLVAVSPALVYYSSEVKPYGVDAAASVGLLVVASRQDRLEPRGVSLFSGAAAVSVLFSFTTVFLAVAVVAVAGTQAVRRRHLTSVAIMAIGAFIWSALFVVEFLRSLRPTDDSAGLRLFWAAGYVSHPLICQHLAMVARGWHEYRSISV